jgi:hypothetical protein
MMICMVILRLRGWLNHMNGISSPCGIRSKVYAGLVFDVREAVDVASASEVAGLCPSFLLPDIAAAAAGGGWGIGVSIILQVTCLSCGGSEQIGNSTRAVVIGPISAGRLWRCSSRLVNHYILRWGEDSRGPPFDE